METLRTYVDSMFAKLPDTPEVRRAREEIWQMMEDKYQERIQEGDSENEAVGRVISEFGSLEELSEALGLEHVISESAAETQRPTMTMDEVQSYLKERKRYAWLQAIGVALCIGCLIHPIMIDSRSGAVLMFVMIGCGVGLFIINGILNDKWEYLEKEGYVLDFETAEWVKSEREHYRPAHAIILAAGVLLCIVSIIPPILLGELPEDFKLGGFRIDMGNLSAASLFFMLAVGVMLIVLGNLTDSGYSYLLQRNLMPWAGSVSGGEKEVQYIHPVITNIMSVYWVTVTCIYLSWSFLTFDWGWTWIIWPVAAVLNMVIDNTLKKQGEI